MVQVHEAGDGTYTLLLHGKAKMTGLTRAQADKLVASFAARAARVPDHPADRVPAKPVLRPWNWRDLFRLRGSTC